MALHHYFDVFCPDTSETKARCATRLDAELSAAKYAEQDGYTYVVYDCRAVSEARGSRPAPGSKEKS